ncbi:MULTISPECIES: ParM/StbA family protein [Fluviispira]|uniref:Uncharacterized protein n=1 Tax=Fluviispira sanaruensis TaxID=2493639 RepID=A0A4P2VNY2_FLUSA|nr:MULTISPECIES: ParM/StbA family protein [Fluviispira]BBH54658.1 hypothetical protein JCM31447_31320 [Fluviispira sanaruensis]
MKSISIDSGSSYLKLYTILDGKEIEFSEASLIEEVPEHSQLKSKINVDGKWYVAGRIAELQKTNFQENPELGEFHGSLKQSIQWMHAFESKGLTGDYETLILSLPYDEFAKSDLRKSLKSKTRYEWLNAKNEHRSITFKSIEIVPQGVGALELYKKERGNDLPESLTLVDIGSCTTDVVSVIWDDVDEAYIYKEKGCTSIKDISTSVFIRKLSDKINEKRSLKIRIGYHELAKAINKQRFELQIGSEKIEFKEHYENLRKEFTESLAEKLKNLLGDAWRSTQNTILTGGGENFILPWDCERRTARMDIFANVKGQFMMV